MSDYTENVAGELADLALADELVSGDEKIVQNIADMMGASSQSLEEAYLTAVRVRRAEKRARELLASRATARENVQTGADAEEEAQTPPAQG